jgi:hypothetical protein
MQDMALDFHEETYYKKYMAAKLAYEAQHYVLKKNLLKIKQGGGTQHKKGKKGGISKPREITGSQFQEN